MSVAKRATVLALVLTACALPSVEEYAGGTRGAGPGVPDASNVIDGGEEASVIAEAGVDGSDVVDAGLDATPDADASIDTTCPASALLCETFEGDTGSWRKQETLASLGVGDGKSGRGLVVGLDVHDAPRREAFLEKRITLAARKPFTVTKDIKFSTVTNIGLVDIDFYRFYPPFYRAGIRVANYGGNFFVKDYGDAIGSGSSVGDEVPIAPFAANTWVRMSIAVSYPDSTMHVKVTIDGKVVYDGSTNGYAYAQTAPYIIAGVAATDGASTSPLIVATDNVVVTSP